MNHQLSEVFIVGTGSFLPGSPINNDEIEKKLGQVEGEPSRLGSRILKSNGITSRHYAIDEEGRGTHLVEELAVNAIGEALSHSQSNVENLDMLAVGSTLPDLIAPGIASMVHGRLGGKKADILSCAGICGAGAAALKAAYQAVLCGEHQEVVSCGAECPSRILRGKRFKKESNVYDQRGSAHVDEVYNYFSADFLRWMLSDGAGAFILKNRPNKNGLSLKIEWIKTASYAHKFPLCMYAGTTKPTNFKPENALWNKTTEEAHKLEMFALRQDAKLLKEHIVDIVVDYARELKEKGYFQENNIQWFLPHLSSYFFQEQLLQKLKSQGLEIPLERWFTNLKTKGNVGAASIFIILDELFRSKKLKEGESLLLMVPESGRFSVTYALLKVV